MASSLLCGFPLVVRGGGYSLVVIHELLIAVASLLVAHRLSPIQASGFAQVVSVVLDLWILEHRLIVVVQGLNLLYLIHSILELTFFVLSVECTLL